MSNRELDCLIIGLSVGALAALWVGYWLRKRVERWQSRHARRSAKSVPFSDAVHAQRFDQSARNMLAGKPRIIPLKQDPKHYHTHYAGKPQEIPVCADLHETNTTREEAILALAESGFKKSTAAAAVDSCSPEERGSLESWVAAALRRATSQP